MQMKLVRNSKNRILLYPVSPVSVKSSFHIPSTIRKIRMSLHKNGKCLSLTFIALALACCAVPLSLFAQGESAVPFLLIAPNARADGMGEAGGAMADDA